MSVAASGERFLREGTCAGVQRVGYKISLDFAVLASSATRVNKGDRG